MNSIYLPNGANGFSGILSPFPPWSRLQNNNHLSKLQGASAPTANSDWPRLRRYPYRYHVLHPHYGRWCLPFRRWNHFAPHWHSPGRKGWTMLTAKWQGKWKPCWISCLIWTSLSLVHGLCFLFQDDCADVSWYIMICHLQLRKKRTAVNVDFNNVIFIYSWLVNLPPLTYPLQK